MNDAADSTGLGVNCPVATLNTIDMHNSIREIAGNLVQSVKRLKLPESSDGLIERE